MGKHSGVLQGVIAGFFVFSTPAETLVSYVLEATMHLSCCLVVDKLLP